MTQESYMFKMLSDDHIQFIDENDFKIKVSLFVDEVKETVKVKLEPVAKVIWNGKNMARPKITQKILSQIKNYFEIPNSIEFQPNVLDQSRVHPRYAMNFNRRCNLFHQLLFSEEVTDQEKQLSYVHGLSFVGNAILRFVASLIIFSETKKDTSNDKLEAYIRIMLDPKYLANHCEESGWASVLAYNAKKLSLYSKKGEKVYTDQLKGFIGALYESNGLDKLPEILEIAKRLLTTNTDLSFESLVKKEIDVSSLCLGGLFGFGMGMFTMVMISYFLIYHY